jgi:hypothetical protein
VNHYRYQITFSLETSCVTCRTVIR